MKIDKKMLESWKKMREPSDVLAMIEANPGTYYTAYYRAFLGNAPLPIVEIMKAFYVAKAIRIKRLVK